jgi:hypothetical protein
MIDDLLDIAEELAGRDKGKPRQASLRRAMSSAYYAVFNTFGWMCADTLVGTRIDWRASRVIHRSLDHEALRRVFQQARDEKAFGLVVKQLSPVILELQEARESADYDPEWSGHSRDEVRRLVAGARDAIEKIRTLDEATKRLLAVNLISKPRRASRTQTRNSLQ